jgi:hypothetical protein
MGRSAFGRPALSRNYGPRQTCGSQPTLFPERSASTVEGPFTAWCSQETQTLAILAKAQLTTSSWFPIPTSINRTKVRSHRLEVVHGPPYVVESALPLGDLAMVDSNDAPPVQSLQHYL